MPESSVHSLSRATDSLCQRYADATAYSKRVVSSQAPYPAATFPQSRSQGHASAADRAASAQPFCRAKFRCLPAFAPSAKTRGLRSSPKRPRPSSHGAWRCPKRSRNFDFRRSSRVGNPASPRQRPPKSSRSEHPPKSPRDQNKFGPRACRRKVPEAAGKFRKRLSRSGLVLSE
jgi:hypothetical protein